MKVVICDDDAAFCDLFSRMLEEQFTARQWPLDYVVFTSGQTLLVSDLTDVQIVFLDIDMPGVNGMEVAHQLREKSKELIIIFVTAFPQYALEGYSVEALRYLLKDDLAGQLPVCVNAILEKLSARRRYIKIQTPDRLVTVSLDDILYFEGTVSRRALLHLRDSSPVECMGRVADYEARLAEDGFLRIQRSFLVNMQFIEDIRNYTAKITGGETLAVSRQDYRKITRQYVTWKVRQA